MKPTLSSPQASPPTQASGLAGFQQAFVQALFDDDAPRGLAAQPGFAVYRNTVMGGCIDALQANYPVVAALVGRDCFRAAADDYVKRSPPADVRLMVYGADFEIFLRSLPLGAELPWLAGVARFERLWREAHLAADAPALDAAALAALPPAALVDLRLEAHPAARWQWFDDAPVPGIWRAHQSEDERLCRAALEALDWRAGGVLLTRPHGQVQVVPASRAACAFLDACVRSASLPAALAAAAVASEADASSLAPDAAGTALGGPEAFDASALLRFLLDAGALRALDPI